MCLLRARAEHSNRGFLEISNTAKDISRKINHFLDFKQVWVTLLVTMVVDRVLGSTPVNTQSGDISTLPLLWPFSLCMADG